MTETETTEIVKAEVVEENSLTIDENKRLKELESVIFTNFKAFYEVGKALKEIQESKLYKATFETFEGYCKNVWDIGKAHAYRLINSSNVLDNIQKSFITGDEQEDAKCLQLETNKSSQLGTLPLNEAQIRPLIGLPQKTQRKVWQEALEEANKSGERITARLIEKCARGYRISDREEEIKQIKDRINNSKHDKKTSEEFLTAYNKLYEAIRLSIKYKWETSDKSLEKQYLEALLKLYKTT